MGWTISLVMVIVFFAIKGIVNSQRKKLFNQILSELQLESIDVKIKEFDDMINVKSRQSLNNYSDVKYFQDNGSFEKVKKRSEEKEQVRAILSDFLKDNTYKNKPQYGYVEIKLKKYMELADGFRVRVSYTTPSGNRTVSGTLYISNSRIDELTAHPEYLMTKGEYNKLIKKHAKDELDSKKRALYDRVNAIIEFASKSKETLILKSQKDILDELIQKLFDKTVNSIQKVSSVDSAAWSMLENYIFSIETQIQEIVLKDKQISEYYASDDFLEIKETCILLIQSQKEFNEYIDEKAQSISKLFGTRIARNETENEDVYNFIRAYKKSINPFTAEVSSTVFGSAENDPIGYIVKYFYPSKSQYPEQIEKLRILIEELETLKEAKTIIDNYKLDYNQYIQNVPQYVFDNDEEGFYSRLGLAIIDESVLNVEYSFTYTSNGGMAQRTFTVPMNEENITELIHRLESKLSLATQTKEQRALMTTKLRNQIKERDNYTCCHCGNSIHAEPNLLLEIDHIIPVSKGGLTQKENLQTLCWKCNRNKGAKIL